MNTDVLIVGGSKAGLQAALDLADAGLGVHLVETSPFFERNGGNIPPYLHHVRQLEILKHPNIHVRTNTRVSDVQKTEDGFQVVLVQHPRYIDLTKCTACGECIDVCPVDAIKIEV